MYWRSSWAHVAVVGELQHHRPHHRDAGAVRLDGAAPQVRHQPVLQLGELPGDVDRLLVERPRHPVGLRPVQPGVRGQQAERRPPLEQRGGRACPRTRRCRGSRSRTRRGRARGRRAATRPSTGRSTRSRRPSARGTAGRPPWPSGRTAPPRPRRVRRAHLVEHGLVVEERVVVVHQGRVGAVVPHDVGGDALAEVGLDGVDPRVEQRAHLAGEPRRARPGW